MQFLESCRHTLVRPFLGKMGWTGTVNLIPQNCLGVRFAVGTLPLSEQMWEVCYLLLEWGMYLSGYVSGWSNVASYLHSKPLFLRNTQTAAARMSEVLRAVLLSRGRQWTILYTAPYTGSSACYVGCDSRDYAGLVLTPLNPKA